MNTAPDPDDEALAQALHATRRMHDAPEAVVQRALSLFAATRPAPLQPQRPRLLALLQFDSAGASPLAFGRRSGGSAMRQLLFSLEGRDIDLRIAPAAVAGQFELSGQVLGPDAGGTVLLAGPDGADEHAAALSELGEFRLPPVAAGQWHLTLDLGELAIDLPPLNIPLPPAGA